MLGVVIFSSKNPERTADYVRNQLPRLAQDYVAVVVNNGTTMEECRELADMCGGMACGSDDICETLGKVYIVHSPENLGFAKGNNLGVRFLSRNHTCEHLLFSNDDFILPERCDLQPMIDILEEDKSIAAIGPDIVGLDGHHQSPHRIKITPYRQIGWMLFSKLRKKRKAVVETSTDTIPTPAPAEGDCYWVSGAFFLMRFGVFSAVNGFDPDTFLYGEEVILAERLKKLGMRMYFYPEIQVKHLEGATTSSTIGNQKAKEELVKSNCIYYRKYLHTPSPIIRLYRFLNSRNRK